MTEKTGEEFNEEFKNLGEGDRVLFNDRKIPLKVESVDENRAHLKGPQGGEYVLFEAEENNELLIRNKESGRRYATYVEDLRKVGRWKKESENLWKHSKTDTEIRLEKNQASFWTIKTELEYDKPKYGFSEKEYAVEKAEKLMKENPEG